MSVTLNSMCCRECKAWFDPPSSSELCGACRGAMDDAPAPRWSRDMPTVPGWYWVRERSGAVSATCVFMSSGHLVVTTCREGIASSHFLDDIRGEWCGPIEPPKEGE